MSYVEGFLAAVPTANREVYGRYAREVWAIMKDHGAVEMVDCWADDVPKGTLTSFPRAVQCADDETVVFGWTRWPSRAARDAGWKAIEDDPRMASPAIREMPFDGKRMVFGGFTPVVDLR